MTAFRFGEVTSVSSRGYLCQLRLTNTAALAQGPKQVSDPASKLLGEIFRTRIEPSSDLKRYVIDTERVMAANTVAIRRVLACVAAPAGNCFTVTKRGEELKSRHGFPLNLLQTKLFE
jgi:hypothetical protein